jgi:SPP1 family predicted phage head-tail adaptor
MILNAGDLHTRVTLLKSTISKAASGAQTVVYSDFVTKPTVWAKIVNAHGPESVESDALKSTSRMTMTIRYRSDVDATCGVRLNGQTWKFIGTPDNIQNRNQYLELQCELVMGSV